MKSDEELMVAYVSGDKGAFDELFTRYAPLLLRILRRQLRHDDDAHEIVQQTFLQVHRARFDFETTRKLRPWLMTIAYNLKREHFRRRMRRPESVLDFEPSDDRPQVDPIEQATNAARLRRALGTLPEGQREVITMHWFEEQSFPEVAQILGLTVSAVKVRAHRGYQALRKVLEAEAASDPSPDSSGE